MGIRVRLPALNIPLVSRLSISAKISVGFLVILLIMAANSIFAVVVFDKAATGVSHYTTSVGAVNSARDLERQFLAYLSNVEAFAVNGSSLTLANAKLDAKALQQQATTAMDANPGSRDRFENLAKQFTEHATKFESYAALRLEQASIKRDLLIPMSQEIISQIESVLGSGQSNDNQELINISNAMLKAMMRTMISVERIYAEYNSDDKKAIDSSIKFLLDLMPTAEDNGKKDPLALEAIQSLKLKLVSIEKELNRSISTIENAAGVKNNELTPIARRASDITLGIRQSGASAQREIENETKTLISSSTKMMMISASVGLVISLLLAFFTGSSISRPIRAMCAAMRELAKGNFDVVLPGLGRRDEIGQMAAAVEDFKQEAIARADREAMERAAKDLEAERIRKTELVKFADRFETSVGAIVASVSTSAEQLEQAADTLRGTAETTQSLSSIVAAASEEASTNVQSVASATEELSASVNEIGRQVSESSSIADEAVSQVEVTNSRIRELSESAIRIGDVVKLITAIAEQTNLLALNATIEAARAGEAGRGFAVVAQEVKALATQTAKATDDISTQISAMQSITRESVDSIAGITATIERISNISRTIAVSVEQQSEATREIARNVQNVAEGAVEVGSNIVNVNRGASETGSSSQQVLEAARSLANDGARLHQEIEQFLSSVRAG